MSEGEDRKGVVLVRYEDGSDRTLPKYIYLRMKKSGKRPNVKLLKEGKHWDDLHARIDLYINQSLWYFS